MAVADWSAVVSPVKSCLPSPATFADNAKDKYRCEALVINQAKVVNVSREERHGFLLVSNITNLPNLVQVFRLGNRIAVYHIAPTFDPLPTPPFLKRGFTHL